MVGRVNGDDAGSPSLRSLGRPAKLLTRIKTGQAAAFAFIRVPAFSRATAVLPGVCNDQALSAFIHLDPRPRLLAFGAVAETVPELAAGGRVNR
jgi:hypothetical protein